MINLCPLKGGLLQPPWLEKVGNWEHHSWEILSFRRNFFCFCFVFLFFLNKIKEYIQLRNCGKFSFSSWKFYLYSWEILNFFQVWQPSSMFVCLFVCLFVFFAKWLHVIITDSPPPTIPVPHSMQQHVVLEIALMHYSLRINCWINFQITSDTCQSNHVAKNKGIDDY